MLRQFIESIREGKDGFSLSKPWRLEEKSTGVIIPILRESELKRDYITFPEAKQIKVEDTGQIDYVYVQNNEEKPLLISRGEIFRGKTQERASIHDVLIMPNQGIRVAVRCIHQSQGIRSGSEMEYGGKTPYNVSLDQSQAKTWNSINNFTHTYYSSTTTGIVDQFKDQFTVRSSNVNQVESEKPILMAGAFTNNTYKSPSDDLHKTLADLSNNVREIMKKIPPIENQVGAAFFQKNDFQGMDVFDLPDSWNAIKEDVVAKEGSSFIDRDEDDMFEFKPDKGIKKLQKELSNNYEEKVLYKGDNHSVIQVLSENLVGEGLVYNGKVIHLTLWKKVN